jgi:hypothetical protein
VRGLLDLRYLIKYFLRYFLSESILRLAILYDKYERTTINKPTIIAVSLVSLPIVNLGTAPKRNPSPTEKIISSMDNQQSYSAGKSTQTKASARSGEDDKGKESIQ